VGGNKKGENGPKRVLTRSMGKEGLHSKEGKKGREKMREDAKAEASKQRRKTLYSTGKRNKIEWGREGILAKEEK